MHSQPRSFRLDHTRRVLTLTLVTVLLSSLAVSASDNLLDDYHWSHELHISFGYPIEFSQTRGLLLARSRDEKIVWASQLLGLALPDNPTIQLILPTLFVTAGFTFFVSGTISCVYAIPQLELEAFEQNGESPLSRFGCHEEVHVIVEHAWGNPDTRLLDAPIAFVEGIAGWATNQESLPNQHLEIATLLYRSGKLYPLRSLLTGDHNVFSDKIDQLNIYGAGTRFVEFFIETFGSDAFGAAYQYNWQLADENAKPTDPDIVFRDTCHMPYEEVDQLWREYLDTASDVDSLDATRILNAVIEAHDTLNPVLSELEAAWQKMAWQEIGPSAVALALNQRYAQLESELLSCSVSANIDMLTRQLQETTSALEALAIDWLAAIEAYRTVGERTESSLSSSDQATDTLPYVYLEIADEYEAVGDTHMAGLLRQKSEQLDNLYPRSELR
jgi:hypothetical protein